MNYRAKLRGYLTDRNITAKEFADWANIPVSAVNSFSPVFADKIMALLAMEHPLSTPAIPSDLPALIQSFHEVSGLGWRELGARWGVTYTVIFSWTEGKRPSVKAWRAFCAHGGLEDINSFHEPGEWVFHERFGIAQIVNQDKYWLTLRCEDGIDRYCFIESAWNLRRVQP